MRVGVGDWVLGRFAFLSRRKDTTSGPAPKRRRGVEDPRPDEDQPDESLDLLGGAWEAPPSPTREPVSRVRRDRPWVSDVLAAMKKLELPTTFLENPGKFAPFTGTPGVSSFSFWHLQDRVVVPKEVLLQFGYPRSLVIPHDLESAAPWEDPNVDSETFATSIGEAHGSSNQGHGGCDDLTAMYGVGPLVTSAVFSRAFPITTSGDMGLRKERDGHVWLSRGGPIQGGNGVGRPGEASRGHDGRSVRC